MWSHQGMNQVEVRFYKIIVKIISEHFLTFNLANLKVILMICSEYELSSVRGALSASCPGHELSCVRVILDTISP